ncbi:MAG: ABC transporter permease [Anaerolineales bacterium]|nr:ABC transporter permease [Anaerolineales bacterium]
MGRYLIGRIAGIIGVLLAVSLITFFLMKAVPAGPFDIMGIYANVAIPEVVKEQLNVKYGLDKPVIVQYLLFMRNALKLDFGYSFYYQGQTVLQIFQEQWPYSIQLGLLTMGFSIIVGGGLGIAAGMKQGTWVDYLGTAVSLFCLAMPSFVLALLLQIVFAIKLKWVPTGGWDSPEQWILPVMANSLGPVLILQRYTRASIADVLRSNYVRTAKAKGLPVVRITFVHVFKNALIPILTVGGPMLAGLLIGSFFVESIFRIPGIGQFWVTAIQNRDYPLIMATTLAWTAIISVTYLLTDLAYAAVDPRVTYATEK